MTPEKVNIEDTLFITAMNEDFIKQTQIDGKDQNDDGFHF